MPRSRSASQERAAQYRKAADLTIEQLDWIINYFHRIQKHELARALKRNRTRIVQRYRGY